MTEVNRSTGPSGPVVNAMDDDRSGSVRIQFWVLLIGTLLMVGKVVAWRITGSNTILGDALESIVNIVAGGFALYSLILAAKPRDREHPYGHGKVEFISAGLEGGLVIMAGLLICWRSIHALYDAHRPTELGIGIIITAFTGAVNLVMGLLLKKRARKVHSITMEASGTHLLSDAWSTAAMIVGLSLIAITHLTWLDPVFALVFAGFIMYSGAQVLRRAVAGIMDEADLKLASRVIAILEEHRKPQWVDVHNFRMIQYGSILHIDCHVTLPWYHSLEQAHDEIAAMERLVNESCDRDVELFIHMDPCIPTSCSICSLIDCTHRKAPHQRTIPWDLDSVLGNAKHGSSGSNV
ncbi:MAG: cation transporter [Flavobacteriales bacterium]|nr:cation transporter [Flavobacteriales bacterium]